MNVLSACAKKNNNNNGIVGVSIFNSSVPANPNKINRGTASCCFLLQNIWISITQIMPLLIVTLGHVLKLFYRRQGSLAHIWAGNCTRSGRVCTSLCTSIKKRRWLFSFAPRQHSAIVFKRITRSLELLITLYFYTAAAFAAQMLCVFRWCSTEREQHILLTSLRASMWEEVIAGKHSLCAMSSSTAKIRTWGMLTMQRGDMLCRRFAAVFFRN